MAKIDGKIKVSIESTVHNLLRETAQTIMDEFGLRIDDVQFSWVDTSTVEHTSAVVEVVNTSMTTGQKVK